MKILQVCNISSEFRGSFINDLILLNKYLIDKGDNVDFIFPIQAKNREWVNELTSNNNNIFFIDNSKGIKDISFVVSIFKILAKNKYDIIHTHYEGFDICIAILQRLFIFRKTKVIWHCHDCFFDISKLDTSKLKYLKKYYLIVGKKVTFIAINEYFKQSLIELGVDKNKVLLVENGIYVDDLKIVHKNKDNIYKFVTTGWNYYIKGVDIILKACEILNQNDYDFECYINGNENTFLEIKKYFNNSLPSFVKFQNHQVDRNKIYDGKDAFIQASRMETFSYSVCEATYVGLPVICNSIEGLMWAHELKTVSFFEHDNPEDLAIKMMDLINNKHTNDNIAIYRDVIERKFTAKVWVENIYSKYLMLCEE